MTALKTVIKFSCRQMLRSIASINRSCSRYSVCNGYVWQSCLWGSMLVARKLDKPKLVDQSLPERLPSGIIGLAWAPKPLAFKVIPTVATTLILRSSV